MSNANQLEVQTSLVNEANQQFGMALNVSDVTFGQPELLDDTILDFSNPAARNSSVLMIAGGDQSDGRVEIATHYNRLQLQKITQFFSTSFASNGEQTIHDLLPRLSARFGYSFEPVDFLPNVFVNVGEAGDKEALFQAQDASLGFFGQVNITLTAG